LGVFGISQERWHGGQSELGSAWRVGDVIGFALDMRAAGAAAMSVSVNGSIAPRTGWRSAATTLTFWLRCAETDNLPSGEAALGIYWRR